MPDADSLQSFIDDHERRDRIRRFQFTLFRGGSILALISSIIVTVPIVFNPALQIYWLHRRFAPQLAFAILILTGLSLIGMVVSVMQVNVEKKTGIRSSAYLVILLAIFLLNNVIATGIAITLDYQTLDSEPTPRAVYYLTFHDQIFGEGDYELFRCDAVGVFCREVLWEGSGVYRNEVRVIEGNFDMRFRLRPLEGG